MPIRFRCSYCDKLLGIAQRKAGLEVTCPQCKGRMRVPKPNAAVPSSVGRAGSTASETHRNGAPKKAEVRRPADSGPREMTRLFENDDFERLLAAGTLPTPNGDGSHSPTPSVEKLASEAPKISDRDLFAIDLDAPEASAFDDLPEGRRYDSNGKRLWPAICLTAILFFGLGVLAAYLAFKHR